MIERWTEFQGGPNRVDRDGLRVTLNSRGTLLLNGRTYEAMNTPSAVQLLFDENNSIIGLRAADPRLHNAFPVKQKDNQTNRLVHASPFCKHWGIKVKRTVLFNNVDMTNEGVLKLELNKTTSIGRGRW